MRDIAWVLKVQGDAVDHAYLAHWVVELGVEAEWQLVLARINPPTDERA